MLLSNRERACSSVTFFSLSLAFASLCYFVGTWRNVLPVTLVTGALLSFVVFYLSLSEIEEKRNPLINGVAMIVTILPWLFYVMMFIVTLITGLSIQ